MFGRPGEKQRKGDETRIKKGIVSEFELIMVMKPASERKERSATMKDV